jgi:hypothetical protein
MTGDEIIEDDAGDPACWLGLLCPECGAVRESTGTAHLEWCSSRTASSGVALRRAPDEQGGD